MSVFQGLKPEAVWGYFEEICQVPRPSKKEGKVSEYLYNFGKSLGLETIRDGIGNIIIRKPATPGMEKAKGVTLRMGFYDATGDIISDSVVMTFDSASNDSQQREQKHTFRFKNMISKLNGQEVTLRMERQIENTDQYAPYKVETYKVKVMFEAEW